MSLQAKKAAEEERLQRVQEEETAKKKEIMQEQLLRRAMRKSVRLKVFTESQGQCNCKRLLIQLKHNGMIGVHWCIMPKDASSRSD